MKNESILIAGHLKCGTISKLRCVMVINLANQFSY